MSDAVHYPPSGEKFDLARALSLFPKHAWLSGWHRIADHPAPTDRWILLGDVVSKKTYVAEWGSDSYNGPYCWVYGPNGLDHPLRTFVGDVTHWMDIPPLDVT